MKRTLLTILSIISTNLFSQPFSIDLLQDGRIRSEIIKGYKEESIAYANVNDVVKILSDRLTSI
ncbi:MAG: hypothetical protein N3A61_08525, partial [Ignavibacteria bacterium]|nr:hypothetical protein [Ignavibacteria bacterium]